MEVRWNERARKALRNTAHYILFHFGRKSNEEFLRKVYQTERLLEWNPNLGPAEPYIADAPVLYRSIVVNRLNKIIYWINDDVIEIVDFWDTRREPTAQAEQTQ